MVACLARAHPARRGSSALAPLCGRGPGVPPALGARRRSPRLGSARGHGSHGARARPRLPLPRFSASDGRPWRGRARPSSAHLPLPGALPPPCPLLGVLAGALVCHAARRSMAVARPWRPSPARRGALTPARPRRALPLRLARPGSLPAAARRGSLPGTAPARPRRGLGGARGAPAQPVQRAVPPSSSPHPRLARPCLVSRLAPAQRGPGAASARAVVVPLRSAARAQLGPGVCATRQCGLARTCSRGARGALARLVVPSARSSIP
jgi:hypothetical protein